MIIEIFSEAAGASDKSRLRTIEDSDAAAVELIEHCRTAALGGHLDRCRQCGHEATSFNSCRSRHCPKCQTNARNRWLADCDKELLPVSYVHVVFTLPHELAWLALQNKKVVYDLLLRASGATLLEIAA